MPMGQHVEAIPRYSAEIIASDPETKTVQAQMRTGPVHISVYTTPPFFRWPKTGENWMIRRENGSWYLDSILQNEQDPILLKHLNPGDAFVNTSGRVALSNGNILVSEEQNNVKDFGAVGDGVADDTEAIQKAIDATAPHGTVYLPCGKYRTTRELIIPKFISLRGENMYETAIILGGSYYGLLMGATGDAAFGSRVSNLKIEAESEQSEGGAIGWNAVSADMWFDNICFGNHLFYGMDISGRKIAGRGIGSVHLKDLRWLGNGTAVRKSNTAIRVGDSVSLVVGVYANNLQCQAENTTDMKCWLELNYCDTIHFNKVLFQTGTRGVTTQTPGGAFEAVTGLKLTEVVCDNFSDHGFVLKQVRDCALTECNAQGCNFGILTTQEALGVRIKGGAYQINKNHGIVLEQGKHIKISEADLTDNGTEGGGASAGLYVAAGMKYWSMRNCTSGNFYGLGSSQHYGVVIESAASDYYQISDNEFFANKTLAGANPTEIAELKTWTGGPGENKLIGPNIYA